MKHTYKITGMTCGHCVNQVQTALSGISGIASVQVTLDPPEAIIAMDRHVTDEEMNKALSKVGQYSVKMDMGHMEHGSKNKHETSTSDMGHGMDHDMEHAHHGTNKHKGGTEDHKGHQGHGNHHKMMVADFKKRFWVATFLTIPILLLSPMIQEFIGINWSFTGDRMVLFGLSSIIYFYGGWPFLVGLKDELAKKSPGMMTLVAVAISAAYLYSSAVVFGLEGKTFFWELATLIVVMLLGHWIEMRSVLGASKALEALAELMPNEANLVVGDQIKKVKVDTLLNGDIILIKPGEKIAADGFVVDGKSDVNESMLTGESKPVTKTIDDEIIGGAINGSGSIRVKVKGTGSDTYLSKVINLVQEAQSQKSKTQQLADKAAKWLTIIALVAGFGTFAIWMILGRELSFSLERMVTVMVICCPHALGLAIPLVSAISTSISAKNGLLIRNRTAFENSRKIDTIVFDKTGTLTKGSHEVIDIVSVNDAYSKTDILRLAASVEAPSEHHISKGLQRRTTSEELSLSPVSDFEYQSGIGVHGVVEEHKISAGGFLLLEQLKINPPPDNSTGAETKIFIVIDNTLSGYITFADQIRESSAGAIQVLQSNGIRCTLLTGDNEKVASVVAKKLNLDEYHAEVLPDQKQDYIKALQAEGRFVAMTGDGVNDAPALAQADVGIAIGSGTDVAAETADIILVDSDPKDIANLILFGKASYRKMVQNLVWATGYNVVALPLASGFIPGFMISPAFGAALMSASTVICAVNAQLLKSEMENLK